MESLLNPDPTDPNWNADTTRRYADVDPDEHVAVLRPLLSAWLGGYAEAAPAHRGLDFGCGTGRLTDVLLDAGCRQIVAMDENPGMLKAARERLAADSGMANVDLALRRGDEAALPDVEPFDVIVCSLVLMMCKTRQRLQRATTNLLRALRGRGRLLIVLTHPCFRRAGYATFHYEIPADYNYWSSGTPYQVVMPADDQPTDATITDHHWTLTDYVEAVRQGGGVVDALHESPAKRNADGSPSGPPAYLVLRVVTSTSDSRSQLR